MASGTQSRGGEICLLFVRVLLIVVFLQTCLSNGARILPCAQSSMFAIFVSWLSCESMYFVFSNLFILSHTNTREEVLKISSPCLPSLWTPHATYSACSHLLFPPSSRMLKQNTNSMKDMLRAMVAAQPDGNGDDGAQAALCALFRRENLAPDRVSCAALMAQTCNTWGGLFHPKGGFRYARNFSFLLVLSRWKCSSLIYIFSLVWFWKRTNKPKNTI